MQRLAALRGQLDERAPPVVGIGPAADQARALEVGHGLRHRLRAHAFGGRQLADARDPPAVEPPEHGPLREREAMLGAQSAHELPEHLSKIARQHRQIGLLGHPPTIKDRVTAQFACIISPDVGDRRKPTQIPRGGARSDDRYKWIALSNTTLGVLLATLDASITLIAMPAIFRGIHLDPLVAANSFYLLWMILGFLVVSSVLIVSLGRLGDMYGRVRIYNLGFLIYTVASVFLTVDWLTGRAGALFLIIFRIVQGIGAACLLANAAAIITDAFPANQRGMALGINNIVGVSGMFVGLVLGGLLAPIDWRMVFLISVPVGLFGTVWAYLKLEERSVPRRAPIDWAGNLTFGAGLILLMVSVTYGIRPYGSHATGWGSPRVIVLLAGGVAS